MQFSAVFMAEENEEFCNLAHLHYAGALLHSRQLSYLEPLLASITASLSQLIYSLKSLSLRCEFLYSLLSSPSLCEDLLSVGKILCSRDWPARTRHLSVFTNIYTKMTSTLTTGSSRGKYLLFGIKNSSQSN